MAFRYFFLFSAPMKPSYRYREEEEILLLAACRREQRGSRGSHETSKHIIQNTGKGPGMDHSSRSKESQRRMTEWSGKDPCFLLRTG